MKKSVESKSVVLCQVFHNKHLFLIYKFHDQHWHLMHSVHMGINSRFKNNTPSFLPSKSGKFPSSLFRKFPVSILVFYEILPWKLDCSVNTKILKFFILNLILFFKSKPILSKNLAVWIFSYDREKYFCF